MITNTVSDPDIVTIIQNKTMPLRGHRAIKEKDIL
jgi:hypothetical protein